MTYYYVLLAVFILYTASVVGVVLVLVFYFAPRWGHTHAMVFIGICSLMGSLSVHLVISFVLISCIAALVQNGNLMFESDMMLFQVMSVKALGIAIKLTFEGENQFFYFETWIFVAVVITCVLTQMNYLNKVNLS